MVSAIDTLALRQHCKYSSIKTTLQILAAYVLILLPTIIIVRCDMMDQQRQFIMYSKYCLVAY
jgi:hypothetical protein